MMGHGTVRHGLRSRGVVVIGAGLILPLLLAACGDGAGAGTGDDAGSRSDVATAVDASAEADGVPELHQAVLADDHDRVVELLAGGADPDETGPDGATALHLAAFSSNPAHLTSLLEAGANPDEPHAVTGASALDQAVLNTTDEPFYLLLEAGADPGVTDKNGGTPLHTAARTNAGWAILALLEAGADPSAETGGRTFQDDYWGYNPAILNDRARTERAQLIEWLEAHDIPVDPRAGQFREEG